ncbi:MAG: ABC transporter permease [Gemmatimonadetes bacterium]|nr:ABC transporter permease [Gemmatimonadota bacterium]MBP6668932.1 ABC transporter permease [Gemmatimonadales bacterium]MBK6778617.1 ABC transporter permease [Gemmatimonadota bacterium]MBK7349074.1 ABC transporter permease [Gemmatimonadota bacterium]MBK7714637.1 ABC transporter permease [Gemmatimonadota bacterium]
MPLAEAFRLALQSISSAKLRSFFTLLGIIVSVGFLVVVVAIIQGMNSYVKDNLMASMIGTNAFQVRRTPIAPGFLDDEQIKAINRRPLITRADAEVVRRAIPEAVAVALQSGWPTPMSDVIYRNRTVGDVLVFGVTPPYQLVQDYRFAAGDPLADPDVSERRHVVVLGYDIADRLFGPPEMAIGRQVRIAGTQLTVKGVIARKGRVLGQSFDGFVLIPFSTFEGMYGRRKTTVVSVKMADAEALDGAMARAEEAMRLAHQLHPAEENDFTVDKADNVVAFWKQLTGWLFTAIPAVVCIGIVVGGIVIMNIMLMSVNERTREIGIRKSIGATRRDIQRQFLVEAVVLSTLGGLLGVFGGWLLAFAVSSLTPLPARITLWSVAAALLLGAGAGILFGVYPASRAARLDPITALRAE